MKTRYKILLLLFALTTVNMAFAADLDSEDMKYRRSSIYSILVTHSEQKFSKEITEEFLKIPTPDKYNDMNLSVRVLSLNSGVKSPYSIYTLSGVSEPAGTVDASEMMVSKFLEFNMIGSRLVAKWFNRDFYTGQCDMELVKQRGLYNASEFDKELAARSTRGLAMLEDAGEELIGNTFVLVNEIKYIDKSERSKNWGTALALVGSIASAATGIDYLEDAGVLTGAMVSTIKGFRVKIKTYLYQLVWDEETSSTFYKDYYLSAPDMMKAKEFDKARGKFKLKYVGDVTSSGQKSSFLGISEDRPDIMIRKACQRALDENVADLQKKYEQFKIKAPIESVEPEIKVRIGMKEGITSESRFEVLEAQDDNGRVVYKRVGTIRPVPSKIWDNRFMAAEENAYGADFGATTFKKESGGDFYPGLLVRQIK